MDARSPKLFISQRSLAGTVLALLLGLTGLIRSSEARPRPLPGPDPQSAPPAQPVEHVPAPSSSSGTQPKPLGVTPYSIGQPTDEEQLYLEYLNRMRVDPTAEGQRLATTTDARVLSAFAGVGVDLSLMQSEFSTNPPVPPLAMNAQLMAAARWHSGDMFTNQYQGHFQTNGTIVLSPADRISTNGYKISYYGENVFAYAESVFQGHAAFAVDWGVGPGGMQDPPGHRDNMLSPFFREAGVGVVDGVNGAVGPQVVTQDFGTQVSPSPFITGVVYFDLNGNGFYDVGEGIGGVRVDTPGSTYFALTADSGGYAIPVPASGNYTLTFMASGLSNQTVAIVSNLQNSKIDYSPAYSAPTISGPNPAILNQNNVYTATPVAAATAYQWQQAELTPYTLVEGAENGLSNVTVSSSPGYAVISSDLAAAGTFSFNLAHSDRVDQSITLNAVLLVGPDSQLSFSKFLGFSVTNEVAEAQVSSDAGETWKTVWSQAGNDGNSSVDSTFVDEVISLSAFAGQVVQVRFVYAYSGGLHFDFGPGVGLYLDNIAVSNAQQLSDLVISNIPSGRSFTFTPASVTNYLLLVRAQINSRTLPWGPAFAVSVTASSSVPFIRLDSLRMVSGDQVQIDFSVSGFQTGTTFELLRSSDLQSGWTQDSSATLEVLTVNSKFRFTTGTAGAARLFFKVKGT